MLNEYSTIEKVFHHVALNNGFVKKMSFDIDCMVSGYNTDVEARPHVFISGLARAGTTILMKTLYDTDRFVSTTYRDMPFVLMPNLWKLISKHSQKEAVLTSRAHGDGIEISYDSPEAFEEIFWLTFCRQEYIRERGIIPHEVDSEQLDLFRHYVYNLIHSSKCQERTLYISKNNNNIIRLPSIRKAFPNSIILVPFRDPLQHAISLYSQHQKFSAIQDQDQFALKYFNWLGHFEFGLGHKPFLFGERIDLLSENIVANHIDYWLGIWINTYEYLLNNNQGFDYHFVCFETLCTEPVRVLRNIHRKLDIEFDSSVGDQIKSAPSTKENQEASSELLSIAMSIYNELLAKTETFSK